MDVLEQVGVVDQHQVRVEDPGVLVADLPGRDRLDPLDLAAHLRDRPRIRRHSASVSWASGWLVRDLHVTDQDRERLPDRDARARRAAACRSPAHRRRSGYVGVFRLVEPAGGQRDDVVDGLARLAAGGGHLDPVPAEGAERGHAGQARGRGRTGSRVEVAQLDPRVVQPRLLHQPGGGPGVQAVPVGDLHDRGLGARAGRRVRRPARAPATPRSSGRADVELLRGE